MKKQITYLSLLVASAAFVTACGNDEVLATAELPTIESTETHMAGEASEDAVGITDYAYVMSQFASLNQDGSLRERTQYTEQRDEADSTAIYTSVNDRAAARKTFLSLLPSELRSNVITNQDSSEMSYALENDIRTLTYRETSDDSDTIAYVVLPARADYQDIATSLTIVRNQPAATSASKYQVGGYYDVQMRLIFADKNPYNSNEPYYFAKDKEHPISFGTQDRTVYSLCYKVDEKKAYFVFVPPVPAYTTFRDESGRYLVSMIKPNVFWNDPEMENKTDTHYNEEYFVNPTVIGALPNPGTLEDFVAAFQDKDIYSELLKNCPKIFEDEGTWVNTYSIYREGNTTKEKDKLMNYDIRDTAQINKFFFEHYEKLHSIPNHFSWNRMKPVERVLAVTLAFVYSGHDRLSNITDDDSQYFCCPPYLRWGKDLYEMFKNYNDPLEYDPQLHDMALVGNYACSFITDMIFVEADKKLNMVDWMRFFQARLTGQFFWNGRDLQNTENPPLRVLYFAEADIE